VRARTFLQVLVLILVGFGVAFLIFRRDAPAPRATSPDVAVDAEPLMPGVDPLPEAEPLRPETPGGEIPDEETVMAERFAADPALLDVLEDATRDPDPEVRREAEEYLSRPPP
jgi:hypothetical protein